MDTQVRLLDLAEAAMRRHGYGGFSYADIARDAGIRKASIHHHFPAKSDLGLAVLDRYSDRHLTMLGDIRITSRLGGQALTRAIEFYRDAMGTGDDLCLLTALANDANALSPAMRDMLARATLATANCFEELLLSGRKDMSISVAGDPAVEATSILALLNGAQLLARAARDITMFDRAIQPIQTRISRR